MISTRALTRDFVVSRTETVHAVRGISLDVEPGELVAVLGPNGAGKTTTLRMLTTLITPTSGTATVAGYDVTTQPSQVRRRIGYVGQGNGAGHSQRVGDELVGQGVIYGLDRRTAKLRAGELLDALELKDLARRKVSELSGGQRRRLDVAMGLVHAPSLLFLDEPSTGLDPQNRANLWDHILRMREQYAMTIMLTTHYLDEADSMAERVVVVDHGEVIADDTADGLKAKLAGDRLAVTVAPGNIARLSELAGKLPGAREVIAVGDEVSVRVADGPAALPELVAAAQRDGVPIAAAQVHRPTLDDVFLNLTGRSLREDSNGKAA
ncbi:ABC-2 type transport system ATP-binding protein [Kribbella pratensis]|uniref:ABC-2 type transport system ATP-binding protein n=1 Tax=Kribbella pratensis TaxID=2512112 RepID=A0ABY2FDT6_9ACTN|nr:ATP-binding cassette domain-containing protein [Kribbella pratensis]TDW89522.1 ABC-2 type transport system ATP-binding protein [Kribbella pratensis]